MRQVMSQSQRHGVPGPCRNARSHRICFFSMVPVARNRSFPLWQKFVFRSEEGTAQRSVQSAGRNSDQRTGLQAQTTVQSACQNSDQRTGLQKDTTVRPSVRMSRTPGRPSIHRSVRPSVRPFFLPPARPSVRPSVCSSVRPSVRAPSVVIASLH